MSNRFDRRRFLIGAGGAMLAIPMLETFAPRGARGQMLAPPKRLVIVTHHNGRMVGNGMPDDWWSPSKTTGPLPASGPPSRMLAELADIRNEIVTIDGIDNVVRHVALDMSCGHTDADLTVLTCTVSASKGQAGGPSLDYVAGLKLRANSAMQPSIILPASATPTGTFYTQPLCAGANGSDPTLLSGNPEIAIGEIFGPPKPASSGNQPPPPPTLHDRLVGRRGSILDGVVKNLTALSSRVNATDRQRLDEHATFIRTLETQLGGAGVGITPSKSCSRPDETKVPHVVPSTYDEYMAKGLDSAWLRGSKDPVTTPYQIENLVQALACDVTRVAVLGLCENPTFKSEFPSSDPFAEDNSVHTTVHSANVVSDVPMKAADLATGFQLFGREFKMLVQRLASMQDTDGSRLLDNTIVVWVSSLGYGSQHLVNDLPIVLAGMKSAFPQGQGRHLVQNRRTLGDLYAQILRMLGGTDMTYGETGTLGALAKAHGVSNLQPEIGASGYISADTPLHAGPLDL
jgi:hypothetical protein